jgi:hypothetical protein
LYGNYEVRDVMSRPTERFRLKPAGRAEVDAAWMMWSASDLAHAGRGLIAKGWQWRKARPADLRDAVRKKSLYQSPTGWAIVEEARPGVLRTTWVATTPENAPGMIDGLLDLTARRERANLTLMLPSLPWAAEAVRRGGSVPAEELVYSLSL